jgi:hypothetical protein
MRSNDLGKLPAPAMLQFKPHRRGATLGASSMRRTAAMVTLITVVVAEALCGRAHLTREDAVPSRLTQRALTSEAPDDRYWPGLGREPCADNRSVVTGPCWHAMRTLRGACSAQVSTGVFD